MGDAITALYKKNKLSAQDTAELLQKADAAGVDFPNPIPDKSAKARDGEEKRDTNAARTMDNWLKKNSQWGQLYWAEVPIRRRKNDNDLSQEWLPFILPHEWLADYLLQPGAWNEGMPEDGTYLAKELQKACDAWGADTMFPIAMHGDGVPVQGRMNQSTLDFLTINLPGSQKFCALRVPICCLDARVNAGWPTIQAICAVITWSLECLGKGVYPTARHDGTSWHKKEDASRKARDGLKMPGMAALVQMRGDWDWNCKWFQAPTWNELAGMCWLCKAKPCTWRHMSKARDGSRSAESLSKADYLESLASRGKNPNPLFTLPNVSNDTMKPDWMHTCDEGIGALCAGQVLKELLNHYPGSNQDSRVKALWEHIVNIYDAQGVPAAKRLKNLTMKDIVKTKKAPDLDKKAAETRYFCPHLVTLTTEKGLHEGSLHDRAVHNVAKYCSKMYQHMEDFNSKELVKAGRKLISQYMALEEEVVELDPSDSRAWRAKPKFHYLSHILDQVEAGNHPRDTWNYRDETFAATMQRLYYRRGGTAQPGKASEKVLLKWMSETDYLSISAASSSSGTK